MKRKQAIRQAFRNVCFKRDNNICKCCDEVATEVHHVTDRNELAEPYKYVKENGISLCNPCHQKAEKFHISGGKEWVEGYHPDQLYALIDSHWRLATIEHYR